MTHSTSPQPEITHFFEPDSNTFAYVVSNLETRKCAIIDSFLDFDYASGTISYEGADDIIRFVQDNAFTVEWIIETHVHADHLSAAPYLQTQVGGKIGIGEQISVVQEVFGKVFNEGTEFRRDGSQFDHLFTDGETYKVGNIDAVAMYTPGHTPACFTHVIGDAAFVGDTLFMPDAGTARADFPGGSAAILFDSVNRILALPDDTRIFICHDYGPNGRELKYETNVAEQKQANIHVKKGTSKDTFVQLREARDSTLAMPRLILPSLQVNMHAGKLPGAEDNGMSYLKIPLNAFK